MTRTIQNLNPPMVPQARASEEGVVAMRGPGGQMMLSAEGPRATAEAGCTGDVVGDGPNSNGVRSLSITIPTN